MASMVRFALHLTWGMAVAACVPAMAASSSCGLAYVSEMPLTYTHGRIMVDVQIGGRTVPMILDTGSNISMLSRATARTVDLRVVPDVGSRFSSHSMRGMAGDSEVSIMVAPHVRIGEVRVPNMRIAVPNGTDTNGIDLLGMNPLAGFDLDLDLIGHRLVMFQGDTACHQPRAFMSAPLYPVAMTGDPRDIYIVIPVTLGGKQLTAMLDTGAQDVVISEEAAARAGLADQITSSDKRGTVTGIGSDKLSVVRHLSAPLTVGGLTVSNMFIDIINRHAYNADMILGMSFLSKVHTWISQSSHAVVFQVPPTASPPIPAH
jgi:clan AA aspartic protease (TIGR02281 family)